MEELVTVQSQNKFYAGYVRGFRFVNGKAINVPKKEAEVMVKEFGFEIVEPEAPKKAKTSRKKQGE